MVFGTIVIFIVSSLVITYLKSNKGTLPQELLNQENSVELKQKTHKVNKGENLWNIAVKYYGDGFKWVEIASENKLMNASIIEVGQELTIPNLDNNQESKAITSTTYEVQKGDTLWDIAIRSYGDGYQWMKIASENKLANPNLIHQGNILVLPR